MIKHKPVIILVGTQLSHNIGSSARAMANFGLYEMRLVAPVLGDKWYDKHAVSMAAGATNVLDNVKLFDDLSEAIADLNMVFATSNRRRYMNKQILDPKTATKQITEFSQNEMKTGIVFGCEKSGLDNDHISMCEKVIEIPVDPNFSSLNLSQAVLAIAYEFYQQCSTSQSNEELSMVKCTRRAKKGELESLITHIVSNLDQGGFLELEEKRDIVIRKIRNILVRSDLTEQEIRMLHGVIACLSGEGRFGR